MPTHQRDLRSALKWFNGLSYDAQDEALAEFMRAHEAGKATKIKELKEQLRVLEGAPANTRKPLAKPAKPTRRHASKGIKVAPKYRDRKTGQTWAGRGVQPVWLREKIAKGAKLESFLINK